ncbi:AAA family ATPase [Agrilactobacillus yilanensis]|uniref:AAA family ATPase n=1 Tax=Agrilactobacillus yilanensis TaxID=2485997 RepID=A0ABW4J9Y4_9LACO|nr:AAA family ATPase [Agrilactobacillus yilanensis]
MYIKSAKIFGFGNLVEQEFEFDSNLTVVFGPNEAGKSTLLAFITSILFGFATKKRPYEQYIPKTTGRYGGELVLSVNQHELLLRRTGGSTGGELETFIDQQKVDNDTFYKMIHPLTKDLFKSLFYFDTNEMLKISDLNKNELMQQILAIGAVNSGDWLATAQNFENEAKALYKSSGRKPPINQKLLHYHQLEEKITQAKRSLPKYLSLQQQSDQVTTKLNYLIQSQQETDHRVQTLTHLQQLWPSYEQYLSLQQHLDETVNAAQIETTYEQYQQIQTKIDLQTDFIEKRRSENAANQSVNENYVKYAEDYQKIQQQLPHIQTLVSRRETLQKRIAENKDQLQQLQQSNEMITADMTPLSSEDLSLVSQDNTQLQTQSALKEQLTQSDTELQLEENKYVRDLNQIQAAQQTDDSPAENQKFLNGLILLGALLTVVGLFMPSIVKIIALAGVGIIGLSLYQKRVVVARQHEDMAEDPNAQVMLQQVDQIKARRHDLGVKLQDTNQKIAALTQELASINQKYNLSPEFDPLKLQPLLTTMTQLAEDIQKQESELAEMQQTLKAFDNLTEFLQESLSQSPIFSKAYFDTLKQAVQTYERDAAENQETILAQEQLQGWLKQQKAEIADLKWQQQQLLQQYQFADFEQLQQATQDLKTVASNQERYKFLSEQLQANLDQLHQFDNLKGLEAQLDSQKQQLAQITEQANQLSQNANDLTVDLAQLATSDKLQELQQQLANLQTELLDEIQDYLLETLTAQWIRKTLEAASQNRLPQILEQAERYFKVLTIEKYEKILFRDQNIYVQTADAHEFNVNELSLGTMEQLYLALRLAFTMTLSDLVKMPILLDDALINADQQRQEQLIALIKEISQQNQIIFTTAHQEFLAQFQEQTVIRL